MQKKQKKRVDSATAEGGDTATAKRSKREKQSDPFDFRPKDWVVHSRFDKRVILLRTIKTRRGPPFVVQKTVEIVPDGTPHEMRILDLVPRCNRVVHPLAFAPSEDPSRGVLLFDYYPLGDLAIWKSREFDRKNLKPVPESYIWRFFLQITQALAFLFNHLGPRQEERGALLHRDIKPKNILVVGNGSSTYPSFKLHDFECACWYQQERGTKKSYVGTFEWQAPENPLINTEDAEIWALGACVHFLATGERPIEDTVANRAIQMRKGVRSPDLVEPYSSEGRYCAATVPRRVIPINLNGADQAHMGLTERGIILRQYSDHLNEWMTRCLQQLPDKRPDIRELLDDMGSIALDMLRHIGGTAALADMEATF